MAISFDQVIAVSGGLIGVFDTPCPLCAHLHNPRRKVFRVWRDEESFARYHCARCGAKGSVRRSARSCVPPEAILQLKQEAQAREVAEAIRQLAKARWLWNSSLPSQGSIAERYLRDKRAYLGPLPCTLRFLPARKPEHHPAMIAAFGIPQELEPGTLRLLTADQIAGVHLTLLQPDGTDKAGTGRDKLMVGRSAPTPIVLMPPNDLLGLAVTEGIEDGLSIHEATGLGAWAAGSAGRMPALAPILPGYLDTITVVSDADPVGRKNATDLACALRSRGLHVEILTLSTVQENTYEAA
jgi:hypothetical protein